VPPQELQAAALCDAWVAYIDPVNARRDALIAELQARLREQPALAPDAGAREAALQVVERCSAEYAWQSVAVGLAFWEGILAPVQVWPAGLPGRCLALPRVACRVGGPSAVTPRPCGMRRRRPLALPPHSQAASAVVAAYPYSPTLMALHIGLKAQQRAREQAGSAAPPPAPG
jgi:hypothetical protein